MKPYFIILSTLLFASCGVKEESEEQIRPVFYQEVGKQSMEEVRSFGGISQAKNEAMLSFRVSGEIEEIAVELGDSLAKDVIIARLDSTDYHINYNKAVMSKKNAEVQLIAAKSAYLRIENLYAQNNASLSDYEKAKAQYESALANTRTAEAQVRSARNKLEYTTLRAPYDGTITDILADENEMVGAGHPILAFSSTSNIEVRTAVPENIIGQVKRGQKVTVSFGTLPNKLFNGTIAQVSTSTGHSSTYAVIVRLNESTRQLLPGMTGTVNIPLMIPESKESRVIIPSDAVSHDKDGDFVYIARESGEQGIYVVARKNVKTKELTPQGYLISKGISEGDIVITAGLRFLYEGRKVKLLDNNEK